MLPETQTDEIGLGAAQRPASILGLDIGGTKTAAVLGTADGEILDRAEIATKPSEGLEASFASSVQWEKKCSTGHGKPDEM